MKVLKVIGLFVLFLYIGSALKVSDLHQMSHQAVFLEARTSDQIQNFLNTNKVAVILFYVTWNGPSKGAITQAQKMSLQKGIPLIKVDKDEAESLAEQYNVKRSPSVLLVKDKWNNVIKSRASGDRFALNDMFETAKIA